MKKWFCLLLALLMLLSLSGAVFASGDSSDSRLYEEDDVEFDEYGFPIRGVYDTDDEYRAGVKAFQKKDYESAFKHFRKSAHRGYAGGMYEYANCCENAWGCKRNYALAYEYYFYASERGHSTAQAALGRCYLWGRAVTKDEEEAVRLFRLSAEQEDDLGELWLGYCYQNGCGVEKDIDEARYWYGLSAEQGNSSAWKRLKSL